MDALNVVFDNRLNLNKKAVCSFRNFGPSLCCRVLGAKQTTITIECQETEGLIEKW